jgi:hypothetical protein
MHSAVLVAGCGLHHKLLFLTGQRECIGYCWHLLSQAPAGKRHGVLRYINHDDCMAGGVEICMMSCITVVSAM